MIIHEGRTIRVALHHHKFRIIVVSMESPSVQSIQNKEAKIMSASTVVFVTGANKGIGLALAKFFAKRANHVVVGTSRDLSKAGDLVKAGCKVVELDVGSDESCASLTKKLEDQHIDKVE
jgi:short-subunit dehydrogenase